MNRTTEQDVQAFNLLVAIVEGDDYRGIPLEISLGKFLHWTDLEIKHFQKERKKLKKARAKRNALSSLANSPCCGGGFCGAVGTGTDG